ncbi:hypothetical protein LWC33_30250 [Pseudonocardia sp. RS11V-5]|uniref:hypothetical protein n=1 Tax=Pseudonocardia terrae TaxID=2905831 RepID=UPI001E622F75|nr:hypothetical protein [Pseudonocardia terrae]MCE3555713.1 hypothetical protein [Pseudonocardia terrae]
MSQLSLFSADARPSRLGDLAGLLCGPARITRFGAGDTARISLQVPDAGRAAAVRAAAAPFGIPFELGERTCAGRELRTAYRRDLAGLARAWTGRDRGKTVPAGFQLDGTALRLWVLACGRPDGRGGYVLPLDGTAPGTHDALIAATTRLGLPPARIVLPPCEACRERAAAASAAREGADTTSAASPDTRTDTGADPEADPEAAVETRTGMYTESDIGTDPPTDPAGPPRATDPPAPPHRPSSPSPTRPTPALLLTNGTTALDLAPLPAEPAPAHCRSHHLALVPAPAPECPAAGPALRITGARRLQRLVELVGSAPEDVDTAEWPRHWARPGA